MKHPLPLPGFAAPKADAPMSEEDRQAPVFPVDAPIADQHSLFPGTPAAAPPPVNEKDRAVWPSDLELLTALAEYDLPGETPAPPDAPDTESAPAAGGPPPLTVAGMGLGSSLSPELAAVLEQSEVLAAGNALLARLDHLAAEKIPLRAPLRESLDILLSRRLAGKRVTVPATGDPLFFGIGAALAELLPPEALRILPGVSSLQEACARARLPWHDVRCVSLHGREDFTPLAHAALSGAPICLLTDAERRPDAAARFLLDRGVDWYAVRVFENMGNDNESARRCTLAQTADFSFGPACTALFIPEAPPRRPRLGLPDAALAREGGLLTKGPVRAAALAALRIQPEYTVWDIGAGSGAVGLEASALAHRGAVFAVEQTPARALCIEENRRRFGAANLEVIPGIAPDCLAPLPDPDAVFLGGGLGGSPERGRALLETLCIRLKSGRRLVIACVLMNSLEQGRAVLNELGLDPEITCIQASESSPLAGDLRLAALNPVFLLSCTKK